jgi:hypothetical protein
MYISGKALVISKAKNNINKISRGISTKRRGYDLPFQATVKIL